MTREGSLYVDYKKGEWVSPFDVSREESESWIKIAQRKKAKFEPLCRSIIAVPLELARALNEFFNNQLMPSARDQFYKNVDELYKNKVITKKLYEKILDSKKLIRT
jgi:hypothetical protein